MSIRAAGVNNGTIQGISRFVMGRTRDIYYIGGSDVLPAPLEPQREAFVLSKLGTDKEQEAKSLLIEHNLRLVVYIAKKFDNTGVGVEDLISIGTIGLIKAINTFNPVKKIKLATYASRCIENEILMYLRRNSKTKMEVSIDEPLNVDWDGNELLLSDILGTDEDVISRHLEDEVEISLLAKAISRLTPREQTIIKLRFGIGRAEGRKNPERSSRPSWYFPVLHFKTGKKNYEKTEKRDCALRVKKREKSRSFGKRSSRGCGFLYRRSCLEGHIFFKRD